MCATVIIIAIFTFIQVRVPWVQSFLFYKYFALTRFKNKVYTLYK
jgi:hypothetical protein